MCLVKVVPDFYIYGYGENYIGFAHGADIALALFIAFSIIVFGNQGRVTVNDDAAHQVLEEELHENHVDDVEDETAEHELIHVIANGPAGVDCQNTLDNAWTALFWELLLVDHGHICAERKHIKHQNEGRCQGRQDCEHPDILDESLEHIGKHGDAHKEVKEMHSIPFNADEVAHEGCSQEQCDWKELWLNVIDSPDG